MNETKGFSGWIVLGAVAIFAIWLVITFWDYFLVAGLIGFGAWLIRAGIRWWAVEGRTTYYVNRAIHQDNTAYQRARERMEQLARHYYRW